MINLFKFTNIGNLETKNHFLRSATADNNAADNGHLTDALKKQYLDFAKGGVGTIITGYAYISEMEKAEKKMIGIYDDSFISEYKELTDIVHKAGSKIIMQIVYGGSFSQANPENKNVWGPSAIKHPRSGITPIEMTKDDINKLIEYFVSAARRVKSSGFDGVQIHVAHGYLLSQFLSPLFNKRSDEYGGNIENRARIVMEVYNAIRKEVGDDYPIWVKINSSDETDGGLSTEESFTVPKMLSDAGIDAIEISGGEWRKHKVNERNYYKDAAIELSKRIPTPIILTGGNRELNAMQEIAQNSNVKFFGFARPLMIDPNYINKLEKNL